MRLSENVLGLDWIEFSSGGELVEGCELQASATWGQCLSRIFHTVPVMGASQEPRPPGQSAAWWRLGAL